MKALRLFSAALGLLAAGAIRASDAPAAPRRTEVIFDHPEKFTDVRDSSMPSDRGRDSILSEIREHLVARTASMIPEGYRLTVTFADIKLAGSFEPWRGPQWDDIRIVKAIYPPSFKFTYTVTDPSGRVVRSGTEDITDLDFQTRVVLDTTDHLRYEKQILEDWAHSALRDLGKT
ncbi:MAG TPA: DUF3016 domain-containing protein [Opitutaceae bacterium]|nr:DUF3016 domain-containing protein [Opitutaceae bacterium]